MMYSYKRGTCIIIWLGLLPARRQILGPGCRVSCPVSRVPCLVSRVSCPVSRVSCLWVVQGYSENQVVTIIIIIIINLLIWDWYRCLKNAVGYGMLGISSINVINCLAKILWTDQTLPTICQFVLPIEWLQLAFYKVSELFSDKGFVNSLLDPACPWIFRVR